MRDRLSVMQRLEERRLLSTTFSGADMSGTWALAGMSGTGSIQFDGSKNITGGTITDSSGSTNTPTGSYTISSGGATTIKSGGTNIGAMNASKNFIAVYNGSENGLALLTQSGSGSFSNNDLSGTWYIFVNGDTADNDGLPQGDNDNGNSGQGTINFTSDTGTFSGTNTNDDNGASDSYTGTDSVSSAGGVALNVQDSGSSQDSLSFAGAMSSTKDAVILNPTDLPDAASNNDSRLLVLIHPQGTYSNSTMNGTWTLVDDGNTGTLKFSNGKITGQTTDSGVTDSIAGTYSVAANGTFTAQIFSAGSDGKHSTTTAGAIDGSHDVAVVTQPGSGKDDDMSILINSQATNQAPTNTAPTLTKIATFKTAQGAQPFNISYSSLLAASNATDADGDALSFQITSLGSGTLTLNGSAVAAGTQLSAGESLVWTPPAAAKGNVTAFSVEAIDSATTSKSPVAVKVLTVPEAEVRITASKKRVAPASGRKSASDGIFTLTRIGGDTATAMAISYSISGSAVAGVDYTALSGEVTFAAGKPTASVSILPLADAQANGPVTLVLTLLPGDDGSYAVDSKFSTAAITIAE